MLIGEVARRSGISARMLRHYNAIGLVVPSGRTSGGYREYSAGDVRRLFHVEALRSLGLPLADVARALDEPGFAPAALVDRMIQHSVDTIARERALLARLEHVRDGRPGAWSDVIDLVGMMRGLESARPEERQRIALASDDRARLPASALVDALLEEGEPNVAGALQWALARIGDEAVAALAEALGSADAVVRRRAAQALVKIGSPSARAALARSLSDDDAVVRARAALELGRAGVRESAPTLVRMIIDGTDDVNAAEALGVVARGHAIEDEIVSVLAAALAAPEAAPDERVRLAQALADVPCAAGRRLLDELAADEDRRVALIAGYLLRDET